MPTYEYVCDSCGYEFEQFQSMKDDPIQICPECNKKNVRRLFGTGAGIIFKGSGFYETDYKKKSSPSSSSKEASNSDSSGNSDSKKSSSNSEKKTSKSDSGNKAA